MAKKFHDFWRQFGQKAWRRLEEKPDALARAAWELVNGRLPKLPDHIILSAQLEDLSHCVLAHAISPAGKIAILIGNNGFSCWMVTWSQEEGLREQSMDKQWPFRGDMPHGILFPHGSEEPLVYHGEHNGQNAPKMHIHWGDFHHQLQKQTKNFEIEAWIRDGTQNIVLTTDHWWIYFRKGNQERDWQTKHSEHWMGCINGQFAEERVNRRGVHALFWHDGEVIMPDETHQIDVDTISFAFGGVQFISHSTNVKHQHIWWSDGTRTNHWVNSGDPFHLEGDILVKYGGGAFFWKSESLSDIDLHKHVLDHRVIIKNQVRDDVWNDVWKTLLDPDSTSKRKLNDAFNKAHLLIKNGKVSRRVMLLQERSRRDLLVYALASGVRTEVFPMYGDYFHTLGVVRKGNRVYVLGFHLVGSTLHIIRYPIV